MPGSPGRCPLGAGRLMRAGWCGPGLVGFCEAGRLRGFPQAFRWRGWVCDDDGVVYFPPPVEVVP